MASRPLTNIEQTINLLAQEQLARSAFAGSPIQALQGAPGSGQAGFGSGVQPASTAVDIPAFSQAGVSQNLAANAPPPTGAPQGGGLQGGINTALSAVSLANQAKNLVSGGAAVGGAAAGGAAAVPAAAQFASFGGLSPPAAGIGAGAALGTAASLAAAPLAGTLGFKAAFSGLEKLGLAFGGSNPQRATFGATENGFGVTAAPRIVPGSAVDAVAQSFGDFVGRALTASGVPDLSAVEGTITLDAGRVKIHKDGELVSTHEDPIAGIEAFAKQQGVTDRDFSQLQLPDFGGQFEARVTEREADLRARLPGQSEEMFAGELQALRGGTSLFAGSFNQKPRILEAGP